uniref:cytochrome-c oxidase n=1 Tax=Diplorchis hangzhouensis TaxID=1131906 RepID=A0A3G0WS81_9PLAT|nr:cytochrome c oxidase subunit II [Diplorchis hangzhouensis]
MSFSVYSFCGLYVCDLLTIYVVSLGVFIFFWVMISIVINSFIVKSGVCISFSRGSFESLESILLLLASCFVVVLVLINILVLRSHVGVYSSIDCGLSSIFIIGRQWYWSYSLGEDIFDSYISELVNTVDNCLVLKKGVNYLINVSSSDVVHSFSLPSADLKIDAVPGRVNSVVLNCNVSGVYIGYCSEFCGVGHSYMPIILEVL